MSDSIVWRDDYRIGNETLDGQHQELFRLAAAVQRIEDPIAQVTDLRDILHRLYDYMKYHFKEEEQFMRETGYPELERHQALHRELISALNDIMRASTDLMQLEMNLVDLMNRWLTEHIAAEDAKLAAYARGDDAGEGAGEGAG